MNGSEQSQLSPQELSRLLHAAVEPLRPSPEGYQRIKTGVERRGWWRVPLFAAGGAVLAGLVALSVILLRPAQSSQVVEPSLRPNLTAGTASQSDPSSGGSQAGTTPRASSGPGASQSGTLPVVTPPIDPLTTRPTSPGATRTDAGSPTRPTLTGDRPALAGDLDGDGRTDAVHLSGATVEVTLSRGKTVPVRLPDGSTASRWAGFDLDGDGYSELVVQTGSSGGVDQFAVLRYMADGYISVLSNAASQPVTAGTATAGSTVTSTGFSCTTSGIKLVLGTSTDSGSNYDVTTTTVSPTIDGLAKVGTPTKSTLPASAATPSFAPRCGAWS